MSDNRPRNLVDVFEGQLDRRIFVDEEVYVKELSRIFSRAWLLVGHDSLIPRPNDFFLTYMGQDPVVLARDSTGRLHAYLNQCAHGSNRVIRAEQGNQPMFICPHGWEYLNTGALISAPGIPEDEFKDLPPTVRSLRNVGKISTYAGFIFATWDKNSPSLERYLGEMLWYLDTLVQRREAGIELIGPLKWKGNFNWKIPADNFLGGQFYASITKPDLEGAQLLPALADEDPHSRKGYEASLANGHGIGMRLAENGSEYDELLNLYRPPSLLGYERSIQQEVRDRLGSVRSDQLFPHNATLFPNVSFLWDCPSIHIWHPRGPTETEVWTFAIVDKDAPDSVRTTIRRAVVNLVGPSGILEQGPVNDWVFATQSGNSIVGRGYPMDISMGVGHEQQHPTLPGTVVPRFYSEVAQRGMYGYWAEMLAAKSWRGMMSVRRSSGTTKAARTRGKKKS